LFANGLDGSFFFGVDDDGNPAGFADVKETSEQIRSLIKERISTPLEFSLAACTWRSDLVLMDNDYA